MKSASTLRAEAERLLAEAARIEAAPVDDFANGNVITFDKKVGARTYTYAAIKSRAGWYRTGRPLAYEPSGGRADMLSWDQLLDFIGVDGWTTIEYVTDTARLVDG